MMRALLVALSIVGLAACGSNSGAAVELPPAAEEGRRVYLDKGCASCHGSDGGGGVAPPMIGLFGSERPLADGTTVIADREYLVESIREPSARIVEGYNLPMPVVDMTDAELDAIITYIEALAEVTP